MGDKIIKVCDNCKQDSPRVHPVSGHGVCCLRCVLSLISDSCREGETAITYSLLDRKEQPVLLRVRGKTK